MANKMGKPKRLIEIKDQDDRGFYKFLLSEEITKLNGLFSQYKSILNQIKINQARLDKNDERIECQSNPENTERKYDALYDQAAFFLDMERIIFANFSITIASVSESLIIKLYKLWNSKDINYQDEIGYKTANEYFRNSLKLDLDCYAGFKNNQRARKLGNCFKHTDGKKNEAFVKKYGGEINQPVEYEKEDWQQMIDDTQRLFLAIIDRLEPGLKCDNSSN